MKQCLKCKCNKPFDKFHRDKCSADGRQKYCKVCLSEMVKRSYDKNPEQKKLQNDRIQQRIATIVNEVKASKGCKFCPEKEPVCLDFHHVSDKDENVSYWVKAKSLKKALKEISKCIVVCANCHRKLHADLIRVVNSAR